MSTMEQRIWITIEGFPHPDDETAWSPFITDLEQRGPDLGPVLSWTGASTATIVMSADVHERAELARRGIDLVTESLQATSLDLYPGAIDIEPADDQEPATV